METKKCTKCYEEKNVIEFPRSKSNKCGTGQPCKECGRKLSKKWTRENPEYVKKHRKEQYQYVKEWKKKNRERIREQAKKRWHNDPELRFKEILRRYVKRYIVDKKGMSTEEIVGETVDNVRLHIEKQFKDGMSWDNHGEWHIDHIIPLASGNNREDWIKLNHFTNLQPLWAKENLSKGARLDWDGAGEGALSSSHATASRDAQNPNHPNNTTILKEDEWCHYGGLPSPKAYMD